MDEILEHYGSARDGGGDRIYYGFVLPMCVIWSAIAFVLCCTLVSDYYREKPEYGHNDVPELTVGENN